MLSDTTSSTFKIQRFGGGGEPLWKMAPSSRMSAPGTLRGDWDDSQIAGWTRVRCRGTTAADERGGEILCPHRSMARQLQQRNFDSSSLCTFFSVIRPRGFIVVFCTGFFPILSVFNYFYLDILKIACGHQIQIRQAS
uniref:uncharacterized protein LOC123999370 isoform X3 n=1 Tax=Oncorhynchus gorbuscha TaxID=8017 RepID=UPI001EAF845F|nr:uncharacterized protein LOC123999370 isoform X3 [Oncorhynchus gorbuscha]